MIPSVDVLIITALKDEYEAAKAAAGDEPWADHDAGGTAPYATTTHRGLSVALARPTRMGGRSTSPIATTLAGKLRPVCLAMCGVCAGHPATTAPGDVIVASPAYEWDEGKHSDSGFRPDHQQFPLDARWIRAVQDFIPDTLPSFGLATDEEATVWYLERLAEEQDPRTHPARRRYFPTGTWETRLERLVSDGLIRWRDARLVLTDVGRDLAQRKIYHDVDGPDRLPFEVTAGPMASGSSVMADPAVWGQLEVAQRKIVALEMEAATIATVAAEQRVPHWLVAKGVMDHAGSGKDDRFKAFAARASAEVLFALLGRLLAPATTARGPVKPAARIPGRVKREIVHRLTYDWQDLADVVGVPSHETRRFRPGDEPRDLWDWLAERDRLTDLAGALDEIGRTDLAGLLRPYTG